MALHAIFGDTELPLDSQDTLGDAVYVDAEAETADWPTDVCCPGCKDIYKARALRKGRIHFDPKIDGFQVRVALTCGKCEREWVWTTRCSPEGQIWPKVTVAPVSRDLMPAERMN